MRKLGVAPPVRCCCQKFSVEVKERVSAIAAALCDAAGKDALVSRHLPERVDELSEIAIARLDRIVRELAMP